MTLEPHFIGAPFKSGLFSYYKKWLSPPDAFDPLNNAFIHHGSVIKRRGYKQQGVLIYKGIEGIAGKGNPETGTLANFPIIAGSMSAYDGVETFTDNGDGTLTGDAGGSGTIVYATGVYSLTFNAPVATYFTIYYSYYATDATPSSIMGLQEHVDEVSNARTLVACDQKRACKWNGATSQFDPLYQATGSLNVGASAGNTYVIPTGFTNLARHAVTITVGTESSTDAGGATIPHKTLYIDDSSVNYATGVITLNTMNNPPFGATTQAVSWTVETGDDLFTGDTSQFFNFANWNDSLYMTNNEDRVTVYDGTYLQRPAFSITKAHYDATTNDINTCLDLSVYKNRLLFFRTNENGTVYPQRVLFSKLFIPKNMAYDVPGNGGYADAATGDWYMASGLIRDILVAKFQRSDWNLRYTNNAIDPFRWETVNVSSSCEAPYAIVEYDTSISSAGKKGLVMSDGVSSKRYDDAIEDFYNTNINQEFFKQCYAKKFDALQQSWMLYPARDSGAEVSDKALVYNYHENSWSTYDMPMSCLGIAETTSDETWATIDGTWEANDIPWNFYLTQDENITLYSGGHDNSTVYKLNKTTKDNGSSFGFEIETVDLNPYIKAGKKIQSPYVDIFYDVNVNAEFSVDFFVDGNTSPSVTRTISLTGNTSQAYNFKRVFANLTGSFIKLRFYLTEEQLADSNIANNTIQINGIVFWTRAVGRLI